MEGDSLAMRSIWNQERMGSVWKGTFFRGKTKRFVYKKKIVDQDKFEGFASEKKDSRKIKGELHELIARAIQGNSCLWMFFVIRLAPRGLVGLFIRLAVIFFGGLFLLFEKQQLLHINRNSFRLPVCPARNFHGEYAGRNGTYKTKTRNNVSHTSSIFLLRYLCILYAARLYAVILSFPHYKHQQNVFCTPNTISRITTGYVLKMSCP